MVYRFILIGHVDYGKSTFAGHLLHKVGKFSEHEVLKASNDAEKNKISTWKWAFLLDTEKSERNKGKTHEYSVIPFDYNGDSYELVDTPGHKLFIRSTIEAIGKYMNTTGIIIVSAINNEFNAGFNRGGVIKEQMILLRASGIKNIIVCINKMDVIEWDMNIFNELKDKLHLFIKTLNFSGITYIPVSAYNGTNIMDIFKYIKEYGVIKEIDTINTRSFTSTEIKCKCKIIQCINLISKGYQCIGHVGGKEISLEVSSIKGKTFIKGGDMAVIKFITKQNLFYENQKIIFRDSEYTIGFGIILI